MVFLKHFSVIFSICFAIFSSCGSEKKYTGEASGRKKDTLITDQTGRKITIPRNPKQVVGLAPSSTEMLYFIADTAHIVGRSHACNYPPQVNNKPIVSTYPLDLEQLIALKPDLAITVEGMLSPGDIERIEKEGIPVYVQRFEKVSDIIEGMRVLAVLTDREKQARPLIDSLEQEVKFLEEAAESRSEKPKILGLISNEPIYVFGENSFFSDLIRLAGGQNAVSEVLGSPYPTVSVEYLLKIDPDIIVGLSFEEADSEFFKLYPALKRINAYRNKNMVNFNHDLMTRPGPRFLEAVKELQGIIRKSTFR